jgi:sulfoxide reductase catalytic subunit YedY
MLIQTFEDGFVHPVPSEITPPEVYQNRRQWLQQAGLLGLAASGLGAHAQTARPGELTPLPAKPSALAGAMATDTLTPYKDATTYNNFYEFGTDKLDPVRNVKNFVTSPWSVEIEGMVKKPGRIHLEDLLKVSAMEERIYRMRCVEGWSMVMP